MKTYKELTEEIISEGHNRYPGDDMTMKELKIAVNAAKNILDMLEDGASLQRWQISAIVVASDELASVCTSMRVDHEEEMENDEMEMEYDEYGYPSMYGEEFELDEEDNISKLTKQRNAVSGPLADRRKEALRKSIKTARKAEADKIRKDLGLDEKLKVSDDMGTWVKDFQDSDAPQFKGKSQKERQKMAIAAKLSAMRNEEVELDEAKTDHFIYQKGVPKTQEVVHRGTEQSSKDWIEKNAKFYGHKGKDFVIYKGKYPNVKPSDALDFKYVAEEVELDEAETKYVIKHKKTKEVLNTHNDYATAKDEHEGLGADKKDYGIYKQTKKDAALSNRSAYREEVELDEETDYKVSVDGLPDMYVKGKSPSEIKAGLRKIVKNPKSIRAIERLTPSDVKKTFRDKAAGKEEMEEARILGKGMDKDALAADTNQSDKEYIAQMQIKNKWKKQNPGKKWPGYSKAKSEIK